jgi:hypothetical protein
MWLSVANASNHYYFSNCSLHTSSSVNDAIWIPNAHIEKSSFKFPPKTLHLGLNYNSGKSKIDAKTLINPR